MGCVGGKGKRKSKLVFRVYGVGGYIPKLQLSEALFPETLRLRFPMMDLVYRT